MRPISNLLESLRAIVEASVGYTIKWVRPDFSKEVDEYTENEYTNRKLSEAGIILKTKKDVIAFLKGGQPEEVPKKTLKSRGDNLTLSKKDFDSELSDPGYAKSFRFMEKALGENGSITLPMPILVKKPDGDYHGFAGNRRMNLAWRKDLPITFWVVDAGSEHERNGTSKFVVHKHDATNLHYDFRLEMGGKLKSWAVPKGPSNKMGVKRLAMQTPDHAVSYIGFEGDIPEGQYGAGSVSIWDSGKYDLIEKKKKSIKFALHGKKLKGEFVIYNMDGKRWLLSKTKED